MKLPIPGSRFSNSHFSDADVRQLGKIASGSLGPWLPPPPPGPIFRPVERVGQVGGATGSATGAATAPIE
jgi:hypothetical protein